MVIDIFLFLNEFDILEIRLNELKDVVDLFVVVEGDHTFSGDPKESQFQQIVDKFPKFASRLIRVAVPLDGFDKFDTWKREEKQRDYAKNFLTGAALALGDDDIISFSDVDEIPSAKVIQYYKRIFHSRPLLFLKQPAYYYYLNYRFHLDACASFLTTWKTIKNQSFTTVRNSVKDGNHAEAYWPGGWHFTYMGDHTQVNHKVNSFSHCYEKDTQAFLDRLNVCTNPEERDPKTLRRVPIDTTFPECIRNDVQKWIERGLIKP